MHADRAVRRSFRLAAIADGIVVGDLLAIVLDQLDVALADINLGLVSLAANCLVLVISRLLWPDPDPPEPIAAIVAPEVCKRRARPPLPAQPSAGAR